MANFSKETFGGDKKEGKSFLSFIEDRLAKTLVKLVPSWIETYHLTLTTILWSILIVVFGFLAKENINWLWASSVIILFQYLTDLIDGKIGMLRKTGLIRWGYYMDHFLDYIFLCSILIGYSFVIMDSSKYLLFFILAFFGAFMVNSYLAFSATNKFKISYLNIGPTEIRIVFIIINTLLIFGRTYAVLFLPYILIIALIGLCIVVYRTQKYIWKIDMKNKRS